MRSVRVKCSRLYIPAGMCHVQATWNEDRRNLDGSNNVLIGVRVDFIPSFKGVEYGWGIDDGNGTCSFAPFEVQGWKRYKVGDTKSSRGWLRWGAISPFMPKVYAHDTPLTVQPSGIMLFNLFNRPPVLKCHRPCSVYIYYGETRSEILYIGKAVDPLKRDEQHRRSSPWYSEVGSWEIIERFNSEEAASVKERDLIRTKRPIHNIIHNGEAAVCSQR